MRHALFVGLVVCAVLASAVTQVDAVGSGSEKLVTGRPDLDLTLTDNRVEASESGRLDITVTNSGEVRKTGPEPFVERVTTARNVRLTVVEERIDIPLDVRSGTVAFGTVRDGQPVTATVEYETGDGLEPGRYRIPVRLTYDYTFAVGYDPVERPPGYDDVTFADRSRSEIEYVTVVVGDRSRFEITTNASDLYAGDTGSLTLTVRNAGTETATDASIRLTSPAPTVYFGRPTDPRNTTSVLVSELSPSESRRVRVEVGVRSDAAAGTYPIDARVVYENENGVTTSSDPLTLGVRTLPERTFALRNVETTSMRAGSDDALVAGEILNRGPATARDAVVRLRLEPTTQTDFDADRAEANSTPPGRVSVTNAEAAVGDLAPDEAARVQFSLAVPRDVEPGTRTLTFEVEYRNDEGELRRSRLPIRTTVEVEPAVDRFEVEGVRTAVSIDATNRLALSVRNVDDVTFRDVTVRLSPRPPFSSVSSEAYVASLAPGETATLAYELSVDDDAVPSTQGLRVTVSAVEPDGDTYRSDTRWVGVEIRDRRLLERDGSIVVVGAAVVAVVLLAGYLVTERL